VMQSIAEWFGHGRPKTEGGDLADDSSLAGLT
jgi:hypothetical protein